MVAPKQISLSVFLAWLVLPCAIIPAFAEGAKPIITGSVSAPARGFSSASAVADVNAYRASQGLPPVRLDTATTQAAVEQSRAMAQAASMSHSVTGSLGTRLSQFGLGNARAVENIAMGQRSWREVFEAWKGSSSHDANMRASGMTRIGVAQVAGANGPYWTLILVGEPGKYW